MINLPSGLLAAAAAIQLTHFVPAAPEAAPSPQPGKLSPALSASWFIGKPVEGKDAPPTHFDLGPKNPDSISPTIAASRLLPNVLVRLDAATSVEGSLTYPQGMQMFQLAHQKELTFCTLDSVRSGQHHCLVDTNLDGQVDALAVAKVRLAVPLTLELDHRLTKLASPAAVTMIPREMYQGNDRIALIYIGRRQLGERDATFMIWASREKTARRRAAGSAGGDFPLYLDDLPQQADMGSVKLVNIVRRGKRIEFDVARGFESRAYDARYGGSAEIELGF